MARGTKPRYHEVVGGKKEITQLKSGSLRDGARENHTQRGRPKEGGSGGMGRTTWTEGRGVRIPRLGRCDQRKRNGNGASATGRTVRRRPAEEAAADKESRSIPGAGERPAARALLLNQTPMLCSVSRSEMARNDPSGETPARTGSKRPGRNWESRAEARREAQAS